ncbi:odorant receptor Or2-like [Diorhabda sublineata]|uniref:odorant receptor Or2-like n=1 Tax=Diorhabda sublineata TaxID=1163346 RepID=UPI0024E164D2|nr:odorant receptor Or2-like [Diorhabda sublineata]
MYSTLIFVQCIGSVMVICVLGFQLSVTIPFPSETFFIQSIYLFSMIFQIFCYTWFGQKLMIKSERVTEACYLSKWYEFDFKVKKSLLILMTRCSKAIVLSAGIFDLTLETFTMILRTSYSYMAVIRTVFGDYMTKKQSTP